MGTAEHDDIAAGHRIAMKHATERLAERFRGVFGTATVEQFLAGSYDALAERATIHTHLPLLAERFAGQRLQALARVEGKAHDGRPVVLFLCVHNAGRSQMALGFFAHHAGDGAVGWSGGSEPGATVDPVVVAAMAERGIDVSAEFPKPWTDEVLRAADVVVTMGCGDACPIFPGKRYLDWELDDPDGEEIAGVRPIRDQIERRVLALLADLGVGAAAAAVPPTSVRSA